MSDDNMSSDLPTKVGDPPEIDDEIDEFAESAFDALMMEGEGKSSSEQPEAAEVAEAEESAVSAMVLKPTQQPENRDRAKP